jgi:glycosyltransferase involved in cell wall biosynthesis
MVREANRIALISEHASPVSLLGGSDAGGQNVYVAEISCHLARLGYSIDVFTRRDNPTLPQIIELASGVRVIHLTAGPATNLPKDDIWTYMPAFRDAFLDFCAVNEQSYDLIHSNFWMSGWVATELRRILHIPVAHIFHALGVTKRLHQGNADTSPQERIDVERQIVQDVDYLITPCPNEESELIEYYGADPSRIRMIPLAVDTKMFRPVDRGKIRQQLGLGQDDFVMAYVGRILRRKDIRNIVNALPLLQQKCARESNSPDFHLLVVGGEEETPDQRITPELAVLQQLAAKLHVSEHVHFLGNRQQSILRNYYAASDVFITTPWYEAFGLTPLESMACGRPVVGSAVGGIMFSVAENETGLLVPPQRPDILAEHLFFLLQHPELREQMGRAARQRVLREFTWPLVAERTANVYEEAVTQNMSRSGVMASFWTETFDTLSVGGE